jgi:hypothetical protein
MNDLFYFKIMMMLLIASYAYAVDLMHTYDEQRCTIYNAKINPQDNSAVFEQALKEKQEHIVEYTMDIDEILLEPKKSFMTYPLCKENREAIFKAIMGSEITDKRYALETDEIPTVSINDPLLKYFSAICFVSELSHALMTTIRHDGYEPIDVRDLNRFDDKYKNLFSYSGVTRDEFARWFNEVFSAHEPGFRAENIDLHVKSYDSSEAVVTEFFEFPSILKTDSTTFPIISEGMNRSDTVVRFDFDLKESSSVDVSPEEIDAMHLGKSANFRMRKARIASQGNTCGNPSTGSLGRTFGNPDVADTSIKKETAKDSISSYLKKFHNTLHYDQMNLCYSEFDEEDIVAKLSETTLDDGGVVTNFSETALFSIENAKRNAVSVRFLVAFDENSNGDDEGNFY